MRKRKVIIGAPPSGNWSGYVRKSQPGTMKQVSALWHVPAIPNTYTYPNADVLIWIGMDENRPGLLQIGTGADYLTSDGSPRYYGWWEVLPGKKEIQVIPMDQYPVRPGDQITAEIIQLTGTSMYMALNNFTQNWHFAQPIDYNGPRQTADFIVERGFDNATKQSYPLADYGKVTIYNCKINKRAARLHISERIVMEHPLGHAISVPSAPMPRNASTFTVSQPSVGGVQRTRTVKMISKRIGNSTLSVPSHIMTKKGSRKKPSS